MGHTALRADDMMAGVQGGTSVAPGCDELGVGGKEKLRGGLMRLMAIDDEGSKTEGMYSRGQEPRCSCSPIWGSCGRRELFSLQLRGTGGAEI